MFVDILWMFVDILWMFVDILWMFMDILWMFVDILWMFVDIFQPDSECDPVFFLLSDSGPPCLIKPAASSRTERFSPPGPEKLRSIITL